jgi:hypothetical protein
LVAVVAFAMDEISWIANEARSLSSGQQKRGRKGPLSMAFSSQCPPIRPGPLRRSRRMDRSTTALASPRESELTSKLDHGAFGLAGPSRQPAPPSTLPPANSAMRHAIAGHLVTCTGRPLTVWGWENRSRESMVSSA